MKRTALKRRTPLRSKPGPGIKLDVLQALWRRSQGRCEVRTCHRSAEHPHHRLRRSQGGEDSLSNLLCVCAACHRHIHDNPAWAYDQGYMIRSTDAPS